MREYNSGTLLLCIKITTDNFKGLKNGFSAFLKIFFKQKFDFQRFEPTTAVFNLTQHVSQKTILFAKILKKNLEAIQK